jgi:hypothetical protein
MSERSLVRNNTRLRARQHNPSLGPPTHCSAHGCTIPKHKRFFASDCKIRDRETLLACSLTLPKPHARIHRHCSDCTVGQKKQRVFGFGSINNMSIHACPHTMLTQVIAHTLAHMPSLTHSLTCHHSHTRSHAITHTMRSHAITYTMRKQAITHTLSHMHTHTLWSATHRSETGTTTPERATRGWGP